ncbi:MAG: A/G-specific adenine glycosylase [Chitinophagaceae bacterium]|nr:A/G-specific adenine glycosylase [Chitinophagaceae bacterium]MCW5905978.1 A/G-specific adenine glycosylase [Chitinophagaceae bacterium]
MKYTHQQLFTSTLMQWHKKHNKRTMPWKGEKDPYKIWLSEIILQQTRVEQGTAYYEKFIHTYPTIHQLAKAKDEAVFKLWEGLGYYNRCKNLLFTARKIVAEYKGIFPTNYEDILQLKGVGTYTAAAIAAFAYNQPYAVVDGNVFRVLSRYFGIDTAIDSTEGKQLFTKLAYTVLDKKNAALYNQAIMDFGATVCKPFLPQCHQCIIKTHCTAYTNGQVNQLPIKEKKLTKKKRWLYYFIFKCENEILIHQRMNKDIWQNLFEFYCFETDTQIQWNKKLIESVLKELNIQQYHNIHISKEYEQQLTHQHISGKFIQIDLFAIPTTLKTYQWIAEKNIHQLAFPKFINHFMENEGVKKAVNT